MAEIGGLIGGNSYTGDANTIARKYYFLENTGKGIVDFGVFFRYKFNPRLALRIGYDNTGVRGEFKYMNNALSGEYTATLNNMHINVIDMWGEYNFFSYEKDRYKRQSRTYSPYIFAGVGYMIMPSSQTARNSSVTLPFGFGVKFLLAPRLNMNIQWTNRLVFNDNLEGLPEYENTAPVTTSNFMNSDLLTGLSVGLSFDFFRKPCDCNSTTYKSSKTSVRKRPLSNILPRKR